MSDTQSQLKVTGAHTLPRPAGALSRILESVVDVGRVILNRQRGQTEVAIGQPETIAVQCRELINHRGEASGLALAAEILDAFQDLSEEGRWHFFELLLRDFSTDPDTVIHAGNLYTQQPVFERLNELAKAIESPRRKLFRRPNQAPGGTGALVRMRSDLVDRLHERPELTPIDSDLKHLLIAWFNRGFLVLERINWDSSARVLEKIIEYEAVHEINGWDDLRGRLRKDRRLFAFFHPAMPDDPVIFIEIALGKGSADAIQTLLDSDRELLDSSIVDTATFYSISNCHRGLTGISFGNFLIKQVTENLRQELENIQRFETLSPVPGFRRWMEHSLSTGVSVGAIRDDLNIAKVLLNSSQTPDVSVRDASRRLCAHYLVSEKRNGLPLDPVARFHLSNGAYLDRINFAADDSDAGRQRSFGMMVNYVYDLSEIEKNHEAYFSRDLVAASENILKLARV
jgi:malonyl-CoA decarboxylase